MKFTLIGKGQGNTLKYEVEADDAKAALLAVTSQHLKEIRKTLGYENVQWEIEEDFL